MAAKIGVHLSTLYDWDKRGNVGFPNAKFQRYVDVLEALERGASPVHAVGGTSAGRQAALRPPGL